jgi:hypothetical protein
MLYDAHHATDGLSGRLGAMAKAMIADLLLVPAGHPVHAPSMGIV